jgi:SnoaL-like domain
MRATQPTLERLRSYYAALDELRFDEVASFLHEDCEVRFPNGAIVSGRERIISISRKSLGALAGTRHAIANVWEEDGEVIFELEVTYRRKDGQVLVRPGVGIFVLESGSGTIRQQRLFVDNRGVWDSA